MIFADIEYSKDYSNVHYELVNLMGSNFEIIKYGIQGDSWVWIFEENDKVTIDTFSSLKHQVKCDIKGSPLIKKVISVLKQKYEILEYDTPKLEIHEDG